MLMFVILSLKQVFAISLYHRMVDSNFLSTDDRLLRSAVSLSMKNIFSNITNAYSQNSKCFEFGVR